MRRHCLGRAWGSPPRRAVVHPFVLQWVFIGLIVLSVSLSAVVLVSCQRRLRRMELEARMEAAFGTRGGPS